MPLPASLLVQAIIDGLSPSVFVGLLTVDGTLTYANRAALEHIGMRLEDVKGRPFAETPWWQYCASSRRRLSAALHAAAAGEVSRFDVLVEGCDGDVLTMDFLLRPICDRSGKVVYLVTSGRDVSEREAAAELIQYLANYDELTGLPKRTLLYDHLQQAIACTDSDQFAISALHINLDRFQLVVDIFGHPVGDELLKLTAQRLRECVGELPLIARVADHEFVVVLASGTDEESATQTAQHIVNIFNQPVEIGEQNLFVTCRIGIASYPQHAGNADELLKHAGIAKYRAKELGGNCVCGYTLDAGSHDPERLTMAPALYKALEQNQLQLHYQPQIDLQAESVIGIEALLRWHHPQLGMISPAQFIPIAEETGLIVSIGNWALAAACRQMQLLRRGGIAPRRIAINLSARQFRQKDLVRYIETVVQQTGIATTDLAFELTESMLMHDVESAIRTMQELKALGVHLSLDDFGTGYSSMSYLKRFPVDTLKIDQSFVREITTDSNSLAIVEAIIAMALRLGLNVVAEGVETAEQCGLLQARGCYQMQGYLFGKPLPPDQLTQMLSGKTGTKISFMDGARSPVTE